MTEWINPDHRPSKADDIKAFLDDIESVCRKHGMLITSDSRDFMEGMGQGSWIEITDFDERELWHLREARESLSPFYHSERDAAEANKLEGLLTAALADSYLADKIDEAALRKQIETLRKGSEGGR